MKLRAFSALVLGATMVLAAAPASAQSADKVMGLRFEAAFFQDFAVERRDGIRPEGDIRIGYDLPMGLTPLIGFGLRSNTFKAYDADDELLGSMGTTDIVIAAELRYYFRPHIRGLSPYVFGEFNTTIASMGHEDGDGEAVRELDDKVFGDENSFAQLGLGLGLEYKFAKSFGIGAKWGMGIAFRNTSIQKVDGEEDGDNTASTTFGTSNSIYAAFRF